MDTVTRQTDATEAFEVRIDGNSFKPKFTYQIFDDEKLFGYDVPKVVLEYDDNYRPLIDFGYGQKYAFPTDVVGKLKEFVPVASTVRQEWSELPKQDHKQVGKLMASFDGYDVYKASMNQSKELLQRLRILVLLFIDGGSYIDETDTTWEVYFLYKDAKVVGFCTIYPYFYYENGGLFEEIPDLKRKRISQFLILPPYQRQGLGTRFLDILMKNMLDDPKIKDISIEDPSLEFEMLRERLCLKYYAAKLDTLPESPTIGEFEACAKELKTDLRNLRQIFEMYILKTQPGNPQLIKQLIKNRIWQQNYVELKSETASDQKEKLQIVYENVIASYRKTLGLPEESEPVEPAAKKMKLQETQA